MMKGSADKKKITIPGKLFFKIGEVSRILGVEPHVVRYWEAEFNCLKPIRSKADQRVYRKKDLEKLLVIRKLLYEDKYTIEGARRQLELARTEQATAMPEEHRLQLREIEKELRVIKLLLSRDETALQKIL